MSQFQESTESVKLTSPDAILILGDFNDKCERWFDSHCNSELGKRLVTLGESNNFFQLIDEPTRITENNNSILDLIFCDSPFLVTDNGVLSPLANLDHCTVFVD